MTILAAAPSNDVAPGTLGFLVVAGMGVVLFFLFRSMSKHLRKVSDQARQADEAAASAPVAAVAPNAEYGDVDAGGAAGADQWPGASP